MQIYNCKKNYHQSLEKQRIEGIHSIMNERFTIFGETVQIQIPKAPKTTKERIEGK